MNHIKKIIMLALIAALVGVMFLAGCGNSDKTDTQEPVSDTQPVVEADTTGEEVLDNTEAQADESVEATTEEVQTDVVPVSDEIKSATLDSAMIQIGDNVYVLGQVTADELSNIGCTFQDKYYDEEITLAKMVEVNFPTELIMEFQGYQYDVQFMNTTTQKAYLGDCVLSYISLDELDNGGPVYLPQDIKIGDSVETVKSTFGKNIEAENSSKYEDSTIDMYGFYDNKYLINLNATIDMNSSLITSLDYSFCGDMLDTVRAEFASSISKGDTVYRFPYDSDFIHYGMLSDLLTDEELDELEDKINPAWVKYYYGDITAEEYAEEIKPLLEEIGFYQKYIDYVNMGDWDITFDYNAEIEKIRENVGDEQFNLFYWFL